MIAPFILFGKTVSFTSKASNLGAGSTWPGHIALELNPHFVKEILGKNTNLKVILVAGTNGKTTTSKLLQFLLEKNNQQVFHNEAGANLVNGIASTLIKHVSITGKLTYNVAIFEVDESNLPLVLEQINKPYAIMLLNLFRDQLDRYGEVNTIASKWLQSLKNLPKETLLITNGDDPMLRYIGENAGLHSFYFGLDESLMTKKEASHDVDFLFCPHCKTKLNFAKLSYSHMGFFKCPKCGFEHRETATFPDLKSRLHGNYNVYNLNASVLFLQKGFGINPKSLNKYLEDFKPAFGRQETIEYRGRTVFLQLSKNPTGFNQSIEAVLEKKKPGDTFLVILNDRIPDGRDVSWIWDVDTEALVKNADKIVISGDRCYDMGLRIKYSNSSEFQIEENLEKALALAIRQTSETKTLFVLPTYSAMLEVRKLLKGRKIS